MYFQVAYTLAKAVDDGQDALIVGRSGDVQNSYATSLERGPSVTDQRNRLVAAWVAEPAFHLDHGALSNLVNHWKLSSVVTMGSGRPVNATLAGDPNSDGNIYNDGLPGYTRNAFIGPDYFTTDMRVTRNVKCGDRIVLNVAAESFNLMNRNNGRVQISDDGFYDSAGQFVAYSTRVGNKRYPGQYLINSRFLMPTNSYAPRQVQFSLRIGF
jgi:hypothetical protein